MGKGDIKTKKGKISAGSYGVLRKRKKAVVIVAKTKTKATKVKKEAPKKVTTAKKATAKK